ncbi:MAG: hypothetical protein WB684_07620, partial [Gaiella sp.]
MTDPGDEWPFDPLLHLNDSPGQAPLEPDPARPLCLGGVALAAARNLVAVLEAERARCVLG